MASDFLCDLYSLRQAADTISRRYFDGHQLVFPAQGRSLARLAEVVVELVAGFNDGFANELGQGAGTVPEVPEAASRPTVIDVTALREAVAPTTRQHISFLVDMARAEALDALGDNRQAVELLDRDI